VGSAVFYPIDVYPLRSSFYGALLSIDASAPFVDISVFHPYDVLPLRSFKIVENLVMVKNCI
jgi:hypothetical protein